MAHAGIRETKRNDFFKRSMHQRSQPCTETPGFLNHFWYAGHFARSTMKPKASALYRLLAPRCTGYVVPRKAWYRSMLRSTWYISAFWVLGPALSELLNVGFALLYFSFSWVHWLSSAWVTVQTAFEVKQAWKRFALECTDLGQVCMASPSHFFPILDAWKIWDNSHTRGNCCFALWKDWSRYHLVLAWSFFNSLTSNEEIR